MLFHLQIYWKVRFILKYFSTIVHKYNCHPSFIYIKDILVLCVSCLIFVSLPRVPFSIDIFLNFIKSQISCFVPTKKKSHYKQLIHAYISCIQIHFHMPEAIFSSQLNANQIFASTKDFLDYTFIEKSIVN